MPILTEFNQKGQLKLVGLEITNHLQEENGHYLMPTSCGNNSTYLGWSVIKYLFV